MKLSELNKNPFRVEELRDQLAHEQKYAALRETYFSKFSELKDSNSKSFWNNKIISESTILETSGIYQDKLKIVSKYLSNKKGKLLDIGFGWGNLEKKIQNFPGLNIAGMDISEEAVKSAKASLNGEFKVGSILKIPFEGNEFDFVVILDVIEHIPPHKVFNAYKEASRVLKKGGFLVISVPVNESLEETVKNGQNPGGHLRVYTEELLKAELKIAGFKVSQIIYRTAFFKFYKLKTILMKFLPFGFRVPNQMIMFAKKI